ncbi:MAG: hypothetical protein FWC89_11345 [Defluviitaleaceae bacterium]|nr:hypothetical protein [Defluviitaleaceae bacterium]
MYEIIKNPKRMSRTQIFEQFKGKWIYMVKPEGPMFSLFDSAVPVVVADFPYEGHETGIYEKLHHEYDGSSMNLSLCSGYNVFGFDEVQKIT